ncbi:hypothetical protein PACTADRAFT_81330 [Pachysolen tannophilus NRRL Y-2460]|uniref:Zn(2)-C6 fungal-type domain-containing protein n=1 Tax=Pachysolen tannophilus NRRL Y-2460 TaxID=669874 RepID=A0A1E4TSQ0_PACTA|nr:hypothetical protein PACTADRAFT_81330 [Pachysolen tannophilus NRRL Y-2460]
MYSNKGSRKYHRLTCTNCRQRKIGCDGLYPFCSNCRSSKQRCVYDKPASISYVRHLENQISKLTKQVKERGDGESENFKKRNLAEGNSETKQQDLELDITNFPFIANGLSVPFEYISQTLKNKNYFDDVESSAEEALNTGRDHDHSWPQEFEFKDQVQGLLKHGFPYFLSKTSIDCMTENESLLRQIVQNKDKQEQNQKVNLDACADSDMEMDSDADLSPLLACVILAFMKSVAIAKTAAPAPAPAPETPATPATTESEKNDHSQLLNMMHKSSQLFAQALFEIPSMELATIGLMYSVMNLNLGGSIKKSWIFNCIACRMAIEAYDQFINSKGKTKNDDEQHTSDLARLLWATYTWDKVVASINNKVPIFPNVPPLPPTSIAYNMFDIISLPQQNDNERSPQNFDTRPFIIATCKCAIILSDIIFNCHRFTKIRIQLLEDVNKVIFSVPKELLPEYNIQWDDPIVLHNREEPYKFIKIPKNFPSEILFSVVMSIAIKLTLYTESFVNISETIDTSTPNNLENRFSIFTKLIKSVKICALFYIILVHKSKENGYRENYLLHTIIHWFRFIMTKNLYRFLLSDKSVKHMVLITYESPSAEIVYKFKRPNYAQELSNASVDDQSDDSRVFHDNSAEITEDHDDTVNDPNLPAEEYVKNIKFAFVNSSHFKGLPIKDKHCYVKFLVAIYIWCCQNIVSSKSAFSKQILKQILSRRPTILEVFAKQQDEVRKIVLKNKKDATLDGDLIDEINLGKLLNLIRELGPLGQQLLKTKDRDNILETNLHDANKPESTSRCEDNAKSCKMKSDNFNRNMSNQSSSTEFSSNPISKTDAEIQPDPEDFTLENQHFLKNNQCINFGMPDPRSNNQNQLPETLFFPNPMNFNTQYFNRASDMTQQNYQNTIDIPYPYMPGGNSTIQQQMAIMAETLQCQNETIRTNMSPTNAINFAHQPIQFGADNTNPDTFFNAQPNKSDAPLDRNEYQKAPANHQFDEQILNGYIQGNFQGPNDTDNS